MASEDPSKDPSHHRVIASLNREQVDFLDKIGKDAQFSSGIKLSRTQILAAMVNVMRALELSGEGVCSIECSFNSPSPFLGQGLVSWHLCR